VSTLAIATLGSALACGAIYRPIELRTALDQHAPADGKRMLDAVLTESKSGKTRESGRDVGRLLLERGSLLMALGEFAGCADDLSRADRLLDLQAMGRSRYLTGGYNPKATVYMYERGWSQALNLPYGAKFYERLLINPLGALCRLELSDSAGACTEARRFGVMSDWTERVAPGRTRPVRAFGELVSALACAHTDPGLSCRSLTRARSLMPALALDEQLLCGSADEKSSRLAVVVAFGRPSRPLSVPERPEVTLASGAETRAERVVLSVDGSSFEAREVLDVDAAVRADYDEGMHAWRVHFMGQTVDVGGWSKEAWEVLPAHVHLRVLELAPGPHRIRVALRGEERGRSVELAPGGWRTSIFYAPW
jgi:hypothetical protein